uniref:Uncharacterized protein n=1 Tax=Oryza meridionalis TaxID=40149 RepID=A0A0E0C7H8_9ORYZ
MAPESGRGFAFAGDRRRRKPLREPSALRSAAAARSDRAREARLNYEATYMGVYSGKEPAKL